MAVNYSDQEQVDKIKDWLKANGPGILVGVVLGLVAISGWQWWQTRSQAHAETASAHYAIMLEAVEQGNTGQVRDQAMILIGEFDKTHYAVLAALLVARLEVEAGDYAAAIIQLQWALAHTKDAALQAIIRLRLARVLLADEQFSQALSELDQVSGQPFTAERAELQGDIFRAQNRPDDARRAYETALMGAGGEQRLRWKLDSLPSAQ